MILQSLHSLYTRLAENPANGLPTPGYSLQNISFSVVIRPDGTLIEIQPCQVESIEIGKNGKEKKTSRPLSLLVPGQAKPSGQGLNPCFLWDNTGYLLGFKPADPKKSESEQEKDRKRNLATFESFKARHLEDESALACEAFSSVCRFLEHWKPEHAADQPILESITSGFGVFQISGKIGFVHQESAIVNWWNSQQAEFTEGEKSICLVTGKTSPIALTHEPAIKGVKDAQSSGAKLVSFNEKAYESFGKEDGRKVGQGRNAPVSEEAAFGYCNALNWLLANRRFRIGDATAVFWTAAPTPAETLFPWMISGVSDAEDSETKQRLQAILERISRGTLDSDDLGDPTVPYFILGLSPNASRLSVRFWHTGTLGELAANLKLHLNQVEVVRQWDESNSKNPEPLHPASKQLLHSMAPARDRDNIPPLLSGSLTRSILLGTRYPDPLINGVMNRIRVVEKKPKGEGSLDNVTYFRAAILKAWLIRNHHQHITTMLDETSTNPGYLLGRLFAVLEKTQQDALPGINATIRDRFYSSASATPRAVFGRLLRMYPNHLGKAQSEWASKIGMENALKRKNGREILSQNILDHLTDFPAHLNLQNQAQFALGYYHQRKAFYPSKPKEQATDTESTDESNL
jgi:CRISPR-associated protein Csd1